MLRLQLLGQCMGTPLAPAVTRAAQVRACRHRQPQRLMATAGQLMGKALDVHRATGQCLGHCFVIKTQRLQRSPLGLQYLGPSQIEAISKGLGVERGQVAQALQRRSKLGLRRRRALKPRSGVEHREQRQIDQVHMGGRRPAQAPGQLQLDAGARQIAFQVVRDPFEQVPPILRRPHGADRHAAGHFVTAGNDHGTAHLPCQPANVQGLDVENILRIDEFQVLRQQQAGVDLAQGSLDRRAHHQQIGDDMVVGITAHHRRFAGQAGAQRLLGEAQGNGDRPRPDTDAIQRQQDRGALLFVAVAIDQVQGKLRPLQAFTMAAVAVRAGHSEPGKSARRTCAQAVFQRQAHAMAEQHEHQVALNKCADDASGGQQFDQPGDTCARRQRQRVQRRNATPVQAGLHLRPGLLCLAIAGCHIDPQPQARQAVDGSTDGALIIASQQ